ncbi:histidine utilization repressor [Afifella aestuarii]|uniref:histidine utilization repressor n=1 Tax=Afifella aestuarii TaxID=1909496 RepID=UPI000FE2E8AE|nr:histidine utilization repressor [Afifella aestuarii]
MGIDAGKTGAGAETPRYAAVKRMIVERIAAGDWPPRHRVPSENELSAKLGLSRMTVNRALRELAGEGVLTRVKGLGTFVSEGKGQTSVFAVRNIADEIAERGHSYAAQVVLLETLEASREIAEDLAVEPGISVFHSLVVHREDGIPVQLEDRLVNPRLAPDYLMQDFTARTPNDYLNAVIAWTEAEHTVEAVLPAAWEARLLAIGRTDPCLSIRRRTFSGDKIVTSVRLVVPGGRYKIKSRHQANAV